MKDKKSSDYFRSIISAIPELIILFDKKGNYLNIWTSKMEDLGAPKNEVIGKNVDEVLPEKIANDFKKYCFITINNNEIQTYEYSLDFKEEKKYFEAHLAPVNAKEDNEVLTVIRNITERKRAQIELERALNRLEVTIKGAKLGLWDWNIKNNVLETSKQCSEVLGYEPTNSFTHWKERIHDEDKARISKIIERVLNGEVSYSKMEYRIKTKEGNYKWIQTIGKVFKWDEKGNPIRVVGIFKDIDERKKVELQLKRQKAYSQQLFNESPESIVLLDNEDRVIKINNSFRELFKYKQDNIVGEKINDLIVPKESKKEAVEKSSKVKNGEETSAEVIRKTKYGERINVEIKAFPIKLDKGQIGIYSIYRDISKRKKEEKRIKYLSFHDEMTDIYNRRYFENEIERLNNSKKLPISIIIGDMDELKYINDNYGHKMGDRFIKKVAKIFKGATRKKDIAARIGGDEFAMMLPGADSRVAQKVCKRIRINTKQYNEKKELPEQLKISLGYAVKMTQDQSLDEIFNKADQRMYKNKKTRGCSRSMDY
ncbi:PAS domain S-box protein [Sporohalobacter salinus]|uniref:sensor domain-containing diguanylate cyclase n=1 Tax=Sporohalobacter salinus TaxID=1494606 RepID=UPI00196164C2|nr:PAS domain S-box protein [Sporohalobacter salinus]MBM7622831.1 diguanylate cyclase (GGDEF)-like protein/PAS domain S-box-containing protein [Sporohalobacter salinus]